MRLTVLVFVSLIASNNSFANGKIIQNDTILMKLVEDVFIILSENKIQRPKYCWLEYKKGSADIDVWDYTYEHIILDIDSSFTNKILKYSQSFCSDSVAYIKELENTSHFLHSEKYEFEFYYKKNDEGTTNIICVLYGLDDYIILENGFKEKL